MIDTVVEDDERRMQFEVLDEDQCQDTELCDGHCQGWTNIFRPTVLKMNDDGFE